MEEKTCDQCDNYSPKPKVKRDCTHCLNWLVAREFFDSEACAQSESPPCDKYKILWQIP